MGLVCHLRNSFILWCLFALHAYHVRAQRNIFNLIKYGGFASPTLDNSKAMISAWNDACKWQGKGAANIVIPRGNYLLNPVKLNGPCKGPIKFLNMGQLQAPPGPTNLDYWINFRYLDRLTIFGGKFHGQGQTSYVHAAQTSRAHSLMSLDFVNNTNIRRVKLINSKKVHLSIFASRNIEISRSTITAPGWSANTDGIKMAISTSIRITDSTIRSGDDCVAILNGSNDVNVTRVKCGPGHGVSIGSMGGNPGEEVKQISVTNCTFSETLNGVRIKSWATPNPGVCSGITFKDIIMDRASNPIIIDQNYCPSGKCPKGDSHVQISGVHFENIKGTSASKVAINLGCSKSNPCKDVALDNINLGYKGTGGGPAIVRCANVRGTSTRVRNPGSCVSRG